MDASPQGRGPVPWTDRLRRAVTGLGVGPIEATALALLVAGAVVAVAVLASMVPDDAPGPHAAAGADPDPGAPNGAPAPGTGTAAENGAGPADPPAPEVDHAPVVVHVAGEVAAPGVYELATGARVADALEAAGGPTPAAILDAVNLARPLRDGEQLHVPDASGAAPDRAPDGGADPDRAAGAPAADGRVDVNRASVADLEQLSGIGPVTAEAIVEFREEHGPFAAVEELAAVSGIGERTVERLADEVVVR